MEQAGAYIYATRCHIYDYVPEYRRRRLDLLEKKPPTSGDYPQSVGTTWLMNFEEVEDTSRAAADILRLSAFLSPDAIPFELLTKGAPELGPNISAALKDAEHNPLILHEELEPLTRYSLISLDPDTDTYSIHLMVQEVLKAGMDEDAQRGWTERVIHSVGRAFPVSEYKSWQACRRLWSQASRAAELFDGRDFTTAKAASFFNRAGSYAHAHALYQKAEWFFSTALLVFRKVLAPDHPDIARVLNNLGLYYCSVGRLEDSVSALRQSVTTHERAFGPDSVEVAEVLLNLANTYLVADQLPEAEPLLARSLEIFESELGPDSHQALLTLNSLGGLYYNLRRFADGEAVLRRGIATSHTLLDQNDPFVGTLCSNLANVRFAQGANEEANVLYVKSMGILGNAFGVDHPEAMRVLFRCESFLRQLKRHTEADELKSLAEAIRAKHTKKDSETRKT
jgi:tetratricopeptide (TPR) repeat protein